MPKAKRALCPAPPPLLSPPPNFLRGCRHTLGAVGMDVDKLPSAMQKTVKQAVATSRAQVTIDPVKLIAADGSEIIIDRRAAMVSGTIKAMLAGPGGLKSSHT